MPLDYRSDHYSFSRMQPYTSPPPLAHGEIPIRLAGIGPNMTALAGEVADGLHTHPTNACPRYLREHVAPHLARGAARTGRDVSAIRIVANPLCATGSDEATVAHQREVQRELLATLFSTPPYWPTLDLYGWRERGERLHGLVREGRWDEMASLVDDEMLDLLVPAAPYEALAEGLADRYRGLAHGVTYPLPLVPEDDALVAAAIARLKAEA